MTEGMAYETALDGGGGRRLTGERKMFRYTVPVDDQPHEFALTSDPVAVAAPQLESVEFWAEYDERAGRTGRSFQVFGTGHPLPEGARWVGTCPRIHGLVWHLYEIRAEWSQ
jgi:hypothetical protein